eukprot:scaffold85671_cov54-Attheya_sp.AAC.1
MMYRSLHWCTCTVAYTGTVAYGMKCTHLYEKSHGDRIPSLGRAAARARVRQQAGATAGFVFWSPPPFAEGMLVCHISSKTSARAVVIVFDSHQLCETDQWAAFKLIPPPYYSKMKFVAAIALLATASQVSGFTSPSFVRTPTSTSRNGATSLSMVLEKPKKLSKLEVLKINSDHLIHPLKEVRCVPLPDWG